MISAAGVVGFSALSGACAALEAACAAGGGVAEPLRAVRNARRRALYTIPALKSA